MRNRLITRAERGLMRYYDFLMNFWFFYRTCRHTLRDAWLLAKAVI